MGAAANEEKTVLVVEDSADDLCLFQMAVKKAGIGYSFRYVHDGEEAIAYLKGESPFEDRKAHPFPDIVFLDLSLPKKDGFEVLDWMRVTPGCQKLKVVVLSGWEYPRHIERAKKAGASMFVQKPIDGSGLARLVASISKAVVEDSEPGSPIGGMILRSADPLG
jgi:CheY-like chemotaxis protein